MRSTIVFAQNDQNYLQWLDEHPDGFVINTTRGKSANYVVLHRSVCKSIQQYTKMARPGGFTERDFIKICSDEIRALSTWVSQNIRADGAFSHICSRCKPE